MILLAGEPVDLVVPRSLSERECVRVAASQNATDLQVFLLVCVAALGLSWPRFRVKQDAPRYQHRVVDYGAAVLEVLRSDRKLPNGHIQKGATMEEIEAQALKAYHLCIDGLITPEQVKAAADFSGAPKAETPSSISGSSAPGGETLDGSELSTQTPLHS